MYNAQSTADIIKKLLIDRKITGKQMAQDCGLGVNVLSNIRRGDVKSIETFEKIADYLGVSVDYLLGRSEAIKKEPALDRQAQTGTLQQIEDEYGQSSREAFTMYIQLDSDDKGEIRGEMKHMLKSDKYSVKDELKNA